MLAVGVRHQTGLGPLQGFGTAGRDQHIVAPLTKLPRRGVDGAASDRR